MRPLALFLSALLLDRRSWDLVVPLLGEDVEREFVEAPTPDPSLAPDAALTAYEARLADRLAREDRQRRIVVAGSSLGAYVAARVVARTEQRDVVCLALGGFARLPREIVEAHGATADGLERGAIAVGDIVAAMGQGAIAPADRTEETERLFSLMSAPLTRETLAWNLRLTSPLADPARAVAPHERRMTLVHGRSDATVPFACSEELASLSRGSKLVPLDTASHVLPLSHPSLVASELTALLRG